MTAAVIRAGSGRSGVGLISVPRGDNRVNNGPLLPAALNEQPNQDDVPDVERERRPTLGHGGHHGRALAPSDSRDKLLTDGDGRTASTPATGGSLPPSGSGHRHQWCVPGHCGGRLCFCDRFQKVDAQDPDEPWHRIRQRAREVA